MIGGQTIFSTVVMSSRLPWAMPSASSRAVCALVFIFQLPAMIGVRATLCSELHQTARVSHGERQRLFGRERTEGARGTRRLVELVDTVADAVLRPQRE